VRPNGVGRCLHAGLARVARRVDEPVLDIGCAVGRSSFELAQTTSQLVLGIDANVAMLRMAQQVLRQRTLRYPRRRIGIVYDRREFFVDFPAMERVDFWAASGMSLPFRADGFGLAVALQVLDSVNSASRPSRPGSAVTRSAARRGARRSPCCARCFHPAAIRSA